MGTSGGSAGGVSFPTIAFPAGTRWAPLGPASPVVGAGYGIGTFRCAPAYLPACSPAGVGAEVVVIGDVGSTYRLGVYRDNGNGLPGALEVDYGTIAADSATAQEIVLAHSFAAGWYWLGGVIQVDVTTQPSIRGLAPEAVAPSFPLPLSIGGVPGAAASNTGVQMTGVAGALPANFGAITITGGGCPRLWFRF